MHALALGFRNAATVSIRSESYRRRCNASILNALSPFNEIPGASLTTNRTEARDFDVNEKRREITVTRFRIVRNKIFWTGDVSMEQGSCAELMALWQVV